LHWLTATRIDESFLRRSATSIGSSISTTSEATTTLQRGQRAASASASARPTSSSSASGWAARKPGRPAG
jgi:hypothetical protein